MTPAEQLAVPLPEGQCRVRCERALHRVMVGPDSRLQFPDHDFKLEAIAAALGTPEMRCTGLRETWIGTLKNRSGIGSLPENLKPHMRAAWQRHNLRFYARNRSHSPEFNEQAPRDLTAPRIVEQRIVYTLRAAWRAFLRSEVRHKLEATLGPIIWNSHLHVNQLQISGGQHWCSVQNQQSLAHRAEYSVGVNLHIHPQWIAQVYRHGLALVDGKFVTEATFEAAPVFSFAGLAPRNRKKRKPNPDVQQLALPDIRADKARVILVDTIRQDHSYYHLVTTQRTASLVGSTWHLE